MRDSGRVSLSQAPLPGQGPGRNRRVLLRRPAPRPGQSSEWEPVPNLVSHRMTAVTPEPEH